MHISRVAAIGLVAYIKTLKISPSKQIGSYDRDSVYPSSAYAHRGESWWQTTERSVISLCLVRHLK